MNICCTGNTESESICQFVSLPCCSSFTKKDDKLLVEGISVSILSIHFVWNSDFYINIVGSNPAALIQSKLP